VKDVAGMLQILLPIKAFFTFELIVFNNQVQPAENVDQ